MSKTAAMDRPAPPPAPSHAQFLLSQTRSSLAHLRTCGALDAATFAEVDRLLTGAVLKEETPSGAAATRAETEEENLGRRNAWLRDTLRDTSLLPTLVETALNIAIPGPILSDNQKEAIVDLVERSQSSIAEAVTNPKIQRKAQSGAYGTAKSSYIGIRKGLNAAGQSMSEMARRREEARLKAEEKKAEKEGKKSMKEELKREREAIIKQRQQDMLEGSSSSASLGTMATAASTDSSAARRASATSRPDLVTSPTALSSATASSRAPSLIPSQMELGIDPDEALMDVDGSALATVTCNRIPSAENNSVAATTQFSPWPGLLLSQTLVAISDEPIPPIRFGFGQIPEESSASSSLLDRTRTKKQPRMMMKTKIRDSNSSEKPDSSREVLRPLPPLNKARPPKVKPGVPFRVALPIQA
ncbi:hypothetical protein FA10DRAFT_261628 [Acaromyces ingoldii]|uniref:Uncharacterized protein n=1 Tax=Acaromyces ingoldii TaxID=215250 RepID=A0A316YGG2_9BASI|nr:hypothetical protein FA10DRAFT_261628 [Acaromyces ingoldii]PWN88206.1 hypothetical protein FA10DRAFT_261628 [Acaromyces ingoldii]